VMILQRKYDSVAHINNAHIHKSDDTAERE
jgi:uncharacterized C2H2 Zn-finger protein